MPTLIAKKTNLKTKPKNNLEKFKFDLWLFTQALKDGMEPDYSDYKEFKLTCENVGYKMLEKLGWKEGEGLGQEGQGITIPVNKYVLTIIELKYWKLSGNISITTQSFHGISIVFPFLLSVKFLSLF